MRRDGHFEEIRLFFEPESVAVIGASPNTDTPHGKAYKALLDNGFKGNIYAVNPKYKTIYNLPCYGSLAAIARHVDLVVIAVAAARTMDVLQQCVQKGVKSVVILTSGFGESSTVGRKLEVEMAALARDSGMRIMGPNCLGIINNINGLWAGFAAPMPKTEIHSPYSFDLISQSGFFGVAIYQMIMEQGIGFARYASIGNQADLTFSDFLGYFIEDDKTKIVGCYIEGLKDGKDFLAAARLALEREKIILAMKVGRTEAGAKAALSHTGSMAGTEQIYEALFRQTGIIRIEHIQQLIDFLTLAVPGRWPKGRRVAIVSVTGGGAVILTDKCIESGLEIAVLQEETTVKLEAVLPSFASRVNPVDVTSQALTNPEILLQSLEALVSDPNVDTVILSLYMQANLMEPILADIIHVCQGAEKPFVFIGRLFGPTSLVVRLESQIFAAGIPLIRDENNATWALSSLVHWYEQARKWRKTFCFPREETQVPSLQLEQGNYILTEHKAFTVLSAYSIPCAPSEITFSADQAVMVAPKMGYPVALKIQSPDMIHKSDVGGLVLNIVNEQQVRHAFQEVNVQVCQQNGEARVEGVLVQKMMPRGIETIIGMKRDPQLGPVIMFGIGGVLAEVMEDVSFKVAPLTKYDAEDMIEEIKGKKVLLGRRGQSGADTKAIVDTLLRVSDLAMQNEKIMEVDINPFIVYEQGDGAVAVDALIVLKEPPA